MERSIIANINVINDPRSPRDKINKKKLAAVAKSTNQSLLGPTIESNRSHTQMVK